MRDCDDGCRQRLQPGNKEQGYVLRKLLRRIYKMGGTLDHPFFRKRSTPDAGAYNICACVTAMLK